jgi:carbon-monoxide dehydrogenase medium subunit
MKPPVFEYRDPRSLAETLSLLSEHGADASILAGGQSLIPLLNLRLARPEYVIDINRVPGLDGVDVSPERVRIGALARVRRLERDADIRRVAPALSEAFGNIAHPQIRSRTTIGGNLAHADPSSELPGVLAAFDGSVELTSSSGVRTVSWRDFFQTVFTTSREPDELLTAVEFPTPAGSTFAFAEVARRPGDYPLAGACIGRLADGALRISVIAVADRPVRLLSTESAARGADLSSAADRRRIAQDAAAEVDPIDDAHGSARFRRGLVSTLVERTLGTMATGVAA